MEFPEESVRHWKFLGMQFWLSFYISKYNEKKMEFKFLMEGSGAQLKMLALGFFVAFL